jgi:hypothetical protein
VKRAGVTAWKYSPDQPRVPKGDPDGGQWTAVAGEVIRVCVAYGQGRSVDEFGNSWYVAFYECTGGLTLKLQGRGKLPGLVRDSY